MEKFIERGTNYTLEHAQLTIYETNCACKGIKFHFNQYVITLMLKGHKTIESNQFRFEFFPGTVFIPEKNTIIEVSIPHASRDNPTKCLVLTVEPTFIQSFYKEILSKRRGKGLLDQNVSSPTKAHYVTNDKLLIEALKKLYKIHISDTSPCQPIVEDLMLKEILIRLFQKESLNLMLDNCHQSIDDDAIRKVTSYITRNLSQKIKVEELCHVAGMGHTTFYEKFKSATQLSPNEYVSRERIKHASILLKKNKHNLKEVAFECGFNSYEYFSSCFKKIQKINPSEYKKKYEIKT